MKRSPTDARGSEQAKWLPSGQPGVSEEGYVVAVKASARRASAAAGRWVNRAGSRREFRSKALAREWARELSGPGATLWIQDATPADDSGVDGYLVSGTRRGRPTPDRTDAGQTTLGRGR